MPPLLSVSRSSSLPLSVSETSGLADKNCMEPRTNARVECRLRRGRNSKRAKESISKEICFKEFVTAQPTQAIKSLGTSL